MFSARLSVRMSICPSPGHVYEPCCCCYWLFLSLIHRSILSYLWYLPTQIQANPKTNIEKQRTAKKKRERKKSKPDPDENAIRSWLAFAREARGIHLITAAPETSSPARDSRSWPGRQKPGAARGSRQICRGPPRRSRCPRSPACRRRRT